MTTSDRLLRRGPYVLLALASALGFLTADLFELDEGLPVAVGLVAAAAVLHYLCADRRWDTARLDDRIGMSYVAVRTALAFTLTWLNPFFAVFAVSGYFDSKLYAGRWRLAVVGATAVTMAGSQAGGFPPSGWLQAFAFLALLALNVGLVTMFTRIEAQQEQVAAERDTTIVELERANAALQQALAENAQLQARLVEQARQTGVRDERERLALEIHDTIAQSLTGVLTQLQAAEDAASTEAARVHRDRASVLARDALGEARRSVQGLMPAQLDDAVLDVALELLVREWSLTTGTASELTITGESRPLHPDVDATVLRVAQEALANVAKHAGASRVGVTLSYTDDELVLDVRDDGRGFELSSATRSEHGDGVGLHGMRQRAQRLAGELVVESEPGGGTAVSLQVPAAVRRG